MRAVLYGRHKVSYNYNTVYTKRLEFRCMTELSVSWLFLRLEQQALHLVEKIKSLGSRLFQLSAKEGELDARQQVNSDHVEFLVNISRATRRKDWAWFEIAEMELQKLYVLKLRNYKKGKLRQCTLINSFSLSTWKWWRMKLGNAISRVLFKLSADLLPYIYLRLIAKINTN